MWGGGFWFFNLHGTNVQWKVWNQDDFLRWLIYSFTSFCFVHTVSSVLNRNMTLDEETVGLIIVSAALFNSPAGCEEPLI